MTTSGTITYTETAIQLATDTLSLLGVLAAGETIAPNDLSFVINALEKMVKAWMAQGIHLWTEESGTIFLVNGQAQYNLQAGVAGAKASDGTNTVETQIVSGGGTSIVVKSTTFQVATMAIGDSIGVVNVNNIIDWGTITNIVGTTVTFTPAMTAATSQGNMVFTYTVQLPRVMSIQSARLRYQTGFDKMVEIKAREDYMRIPEKYSTTGSPIILYYSPQLNNGQVYVWPAPDNASQTLEITYLRTIQDVGNTANTLDFPVEWLECLTYNLAVRVAPAYGLNLSSGGINGNPDILLQAKQYLEDLKAWDAEQPWIQLVPKPDYRK